MPIDLEIKDKTVQAIIDLDTGFIGFTESINGDTIEYYYGDSPLQFKKAFVRKLESMVAAKSFINFKVSGKNEHMRFIGKYLGSCK